MIVIATSVGLIFLGAYVFAGTYGVNVLLRRGISQWVAVQPDDRRISSSMRLALSQLPPAVTAGEMAWREVAPGFDVAELPVVASGSEVDRILLSRFDP